MELHGTLTHIGSLSGTLGNIGGLSGSLTFMAASYIPYTGPYEFTPTRETQTVEIQGTVATDDIIIKPIPSNYGLITWDGSALTVS